MQTDYETLLSPIQVSGVILKNRMVSANALPHFTQGPERYPSDSIINYLAGIAKNGAAIVTFADWSDESLRGFGNGDICHFPVYDLSDPATENSMNQLTDAIHFFGSKASIALSLRPPAGYGVYARNDVKLPAEFMEMMDEAEMGGPAFPMSGSEPGQQMELPPMLGKMGEPGAGQKLMMKLMAKVSAGKSPFPVPKGGKAAPPMPFSFGPEKALTTEQMDEIIEDTLKTLRYYHACGFDMCTLHMAYRSNLLANFLSPLTNKRTDEFGGGMENRARFPLMICRAIKEEFGDEFLIEAQVSGEDGLPGGNTIEDIVRFAKLAEGLIDILQLRAGNGDDAHPTGFNSTEHEPLTLKYASAIKTSGAQILTEPIGGFQNPEDMEKALKEGKADLFGMARAFICDFEFGEKLEEGRGEDITPCIRCNRCHGLHMEGPWLTVCSVNPRMGIENRRSYLVTPPVRQKKVAVIGGGPAGMEAAIIASDRGHAVTLYERSERLGGQLFHTDYSAFKWPLKNYKDYLAAQVKKRPIRVCLGHMAAPEELGTEKYDVILCAMGAQPSFPNIGGIKDEDGQFAENIWNPLEAYGREAELGRRVAIVGGSDIGVETGMYLADCGHEVTVFSRKRQLATASNRVHYYSMMKKYWKNQKNFHSVLCVTTSRVGADEVLYMDQSNRLHTFLCDSVIVCGGMRPLKEEALAFSGCSPVVRVIGDNAGVGNVHSAVRSAYGIASSI